MDDHEAMEKILQAIDRSQFRWRTARGIAKDSKVTLPQVIDVLERAPGIMKARKPNAKGEALFTTKDRYARDATLGTRFLSALTNKIQE